MPKWEEDNYWKSLYEGRLSQKDGGAGQAQKNEEFKKSHPTVEAFKKYCFTEAEKDPNLKTVDPNTGWGGSCLIPEN